MPAPTAGVDPHQKTITVGIVDHNGVEICAESFDNTARGFCDTIDLLTTHGVHTVGIECSGSWGSHVAIAVTAAGFNAVEVPPTRGAAQRRSRRMAKTDIADATNIARAVLAEPTLGPAQALDIYDPLVAKIDAILEHRKALVETRKVMMGFVQDQLWKLPIEIRDQVPTTGKTGSRLAALTDVDLTVASTDAGRYRLSWLLPLIEQDVNLRAEIRSLERLLDALLDQHGTTLRDEVGINTIIAATLLTEVGDPFRFGTESKFARWCGTGAIALSSGEAHGQPVRHRLDFRGNRTVNSVLYITSVTQQQFHPGAKTYLERKRGEGKTGREARRAHKRHLANRVIRRMWRDKQARNQQNPKAA